MDNKRKRLKVLEEQAQPKQQTINIVDVRDLEPEEAAARIEAKRAELDQHDVIIILQCEQGKAATYAVN